MKLTSMLAAVVALAGAAAAPLAAYAQAPSQGETVFNTRCKACHDPNIDRAPSKATLATYPATQIVDALTNGVMKPMASGLSDEDKAAVAAYLTGAQGAPAPQGVPAPQAAPNPQAPPQPPGPQARAAPARVPPGPVFPRAPGHG